MLNERLWAESSDTAKGRADHQRVHTKRVEKRGDIVKLYEFTVFSDRLASLISDSANLYLTYFSGRLARDFQVIGLKVKDPR